MGLSVDVLNQLNAHGNDVLRHNLQYLYESLTVLDRKADALMAFDGLLVAASAFAVEKGGVVPTNRWLRPGVICIIVLALVAAASCLLVTRVSYDFLDNAKVENGILQLGNELESLIAVLKTRTRVYQFGWWLSLLAVVLSTAIAVSMFFIRRGPEGAR